MNPRHPPAHLDAEHIVHASRSSFAPAFRFLPRDRRRDLEVLYAVCRVIDDLADLGDGSIDERREALAAWRAGFTAQDLAGLPDNVRELVRRRSLDPQLFAELIDGAETDLCAPVRMRTRADLNLYCHRVAGVVGLLSLPILGADAQRCAIYAETLGRALQYTNILRDTASDLRRGRIYYPLDELERHGLTPENFADAQEARQRYLGGFAVQTADLFAEAEAMLRKLPSRDRRALCPARLMAAVYSALLRKMQRDGLRVTTQRYRLSTLEKLAALARGLLGA